MWQNTFFPPQTCGYENFMDSHSIILEDKISQVILSMTRDL